MFIFMSHGRRVDYGLAQNALDILNCVRVDPRNDLLVGTVCMANCSVPEDRRDLKLTGKTASRESPLPTVSGAEAKMSPRRSCTAYQSRAGFSTGSSG